MLKYRFVLEGKCENDGKPDGDHLFGRPPPFPRSANDSNCYSLAMCSTARMPGPEPWLARCCAMVINAVLDQEGSESSKSFHIYLSLLFLRVLGFS